MSHYLSKFYICFIFLTAVIFSLSCEKDPIDPERKKKIIFLHHSTGQNIWLGGTSQMQYKLTGKGDVQKYFKNYNKKHPVDYSVKNRFFPSEVPYGWKNYPFDYYNIWIKHGGAVPYQEQPTLEILTTEYDVIVFKHCYPVSNILKDTGNPDIDSEEKRLENYKLQYEALKNKMHEFHDNKFILWTPAIRVQSKLTEAEALRTREFYNWMVTEWDEKGDNIFLWDYYQYATEGGLYLLEKNSAGSNDSHPGSSFSSKLAPLFAKFIIDVIEGRIE